MARRTDLTLILFMAAVLCALAPRPAQAQFTLTNFYSFTTADGSNPQAGLVQAPDGSFYGVTHTGGFGGLNNSGNGVVFRITPEGTEEVLHVFAGSGAEGENPFGGLILASDGNFYGTTFAGGATNNGTVFKITPQGVFTVLYSFGSSSADGSDPATGLIQASDGNLYGTTFFGGTNGFGTVYKITLSGAETVLCSFAGSPDGANPFNGGLLQGADGNFYGTTQSGGSSGNGVVFKITPSGSETVLYSFKGGSADGAAPRSGLILASDGNFYGTTEGGGPSNNGTVFKITPTGIETVLHFFAGGNIDGTTPLDGLIQASDGNFYGTTSLGGSGGSSGNGVVFKVTPSGTETVLHSFAGGLNDGSDPVGGLVEGSDGNLYGTTQLGGSGGAAGTGTVFKLTLQGAETVLHSFPVTIGTDVRGLMLASDGNLYGTNAGGGANKAGAIYKLTPEGEVSLVYAFGASSGDGSSPSGALAEDASGNFYGVTEFGGSSNFGTVFKITPAGVETVLYSFKGGSTDGTGPGLAAGLVLGSDGNFYGTNGGGGPSGKGTIFKITPQGVETVIHFFAGGAADGANQSAALVQGTDGNFYGTTINGGASNLGTVFKITPSGTFTLLHSFAGGSNDGASPFFSGLVQGTDGNFYGVTFDGGNNNNGVVYKITPQGVETVIHFFLGPFVDGANPSNTLVQGLDGNFYGMTFAGGLDNFGTIYEITSQGVFTLLHSCTGGLGDSAELQISSLVPAPDGRIFGAAEAGGINFEGLLFELTPVAGSLTSLSPSSATAGSPAFTLTVNGSRFDNTAVMEWKGSPLATTFVSASELQASVPAADIAAPGTANVTVKQEGVSSNALTFTITNPLPVLSSLSPSSIDAGSPAFTLIAKGSAFLTSSKLDWNGSPLATTFVASSELKAAVPASLLANPGKAKITVVTPSPGGGTSASKSFTILQTTLSLTGVSVVKNADGSYTATLSLTNTGLRTATSAAITNSSLGSAATTTTLPVSLGNLAAGATVTTKLTYPSSAGSPGSSVTLKVSGSFAGGSFSGTEKVTLP